MAVLRRDTTQTVHLPLKVRVEHLHRETQLGGGSRADQVDKGALVRRYDQIKPADTSRHHACCGHLLPRALPHAAHTHPQHGVFCAVLACGCLTVKSCTCVDASDGGMPRTR